MKTILTFALTISFFANAYSQSKNNDPIAIYQQAQDLCDYAAGSSKHFEGLGMGANYLSKLSFSTLHDADSCLNKVISIVGRNPKTLYLLIKIESLDIDAKKWLAAKEDYTLMFKNIDEFFAKIDKKTYPPEKYSEIATIKSDAEEQFKAPQIQNQPTFTSKEEAVNYIIKAIQMYPPKNDDYVAAMFANWDGKNKIEIFGYQYQEASGWCNYYAAEIDLTELQKKDVNFDRDKFDYNYRTHGYYFPKNSIVSKLIGTQGTYQPYFGKIKFKKNIKSIADFYKQIDKKYICEQQGNFDVFFNLIDGQNRITMGELDSDINFIGIMYDCKDNKDFMKNMETGYSKAWDYLYNNK